MARIVMLTLALAATFANAVARAADSEDPAGKYCYELRNAAHQKVCNDRYALRNSSRVSTYVTEPVSTVAVKTHADAMDRGKNHEEARVASGPTK